MNVRMSATYIRIVPEEPENYYWIYSRDGYWLVERGHEHNTRLTTYHITSVNELHNLLSSTKSKI